jgi:hypothetical protein
MLHTWPGCSSVYSSLPWLISHTFLKLPSNISFAFMLAEANLMLSFESIGRSSPRKNLFLKRPCRAYQSS